MKSFRSYSVIHAVAQHCKGFYPVICQPFFFCGKQKPSCNNLYNFLIAHNGFYNDEAAEN